MNRYKNENKICQNCSNAFTIESEDFEFYQKIKVPAPTFCPDCRFQRRLALRNERILYKRNCDLCNKNIISSYNPLQPLKIYCQKCWWGDSWDATSYGQDYDFSKPFFEQYRELFFKTPQIALNGHQSNINSDYVNYIVQAKNSYLCFGGGYFEDVLFSTLALRIKNSAEIYFSFDCDSCYEIMNCSNCFRVAFAQNSKDCFDSYFIEDCVNCHDCILSSGLRNKSFYFKNQQLTKEKYLEEKEKLNESLGKDKDLYKREFIEVIRQVPKKFLNINRSVNCTGDCITNSTNCFKSFNIIQGENCRYSQDLISLSKDVFDSTSLGVNLETVYESMTGSMNINNVLFSSIIRNNSFNIQYSISINSSSNLFGCIGLRNKQYCILNKQYTKEEYEELVPKIIQHINDMPYIDKKGRVYKYGEFFPPEISPFAYNETIAQEYFPLTKEQTLEQGYSWKEPEQRQLTITLNNNQIPDHIKDVTDDITKEIIGCEHKGECNEQCTTAFKIIPQELEFYRKINLPLPRLCPNCRHYQRIKQRNPLKLWRRKCQCAGAHSDMGQVTSDMDSNMSHVSKYQNTSQHSHGDQPCPNEFETTYAPDRPEIVYCEACYQLEIN